MLEPRSRRPRSSPSKLTDEVKAQAVAVRAALEASGLDHGPISVHDKMRAMGLDPVPSTRRWRGSSVRPASPGCEPRKKPRAAWRRFVYPAPNACWQLDATEYVLTGGRKCVIFQLIDDHSRYAVASHVAWGETAEAAIAVFDKAVAAHGVPQRLLSDNGLALNPSRRGVLGQLVAHVAALGVEAITGKPYKPTTQGKNERFHQTLFRYLDKQPLADTLAELQAQVDAFDHIYNTERPHQGLPGRITPAGRVGRDPEGRSATPQTGPARLRAAGPSASRPRPQPPADLPADTHIRTAEHRRHLHARQGHLHGRRRPRLPARPRHQRRQPAHHRHRPRRRDPRRAHPTRTRHHATSATADPPEPAPRTRKCHRSPDTPTVTDVLMQNCHRCPETTLCPKHPM